MVNSNDDPKKKNNTKQIEDILSTFGKKVEVARPISEGDVSLFAKIDPVDWLAAKRVADLVPDDFIIQSLNDPNKGLPYVIAANLMLKLIDQKNPGKAAEIASKVVSQKIEPREFLYQVAGCYTSNFEDLKQTEQKLIKLIHEDAYRNVDSKREEIFHKAYIAAMDSLKQQAQQKATEEFEKGEKRKVLEETKDKLTETTKRDAAQKFERDKPQIFSTEYNRFLAGKQTEARTQAQREFTPAQWTTYVEKAKAGFNTEKQSEAEREVKKDYKRSKQTELRTLKVFPLRRLIAWVAALGLAITAANVFTTCQHNKKYYDKIANPRPSVVEIKDDGLPGLLSGIEEKKVNTVQLVQSQYTLPQFKVSPIRALTDDPVASEAIISARGIDYIKSTEGPQPESVFSQSFSQENFNKKIQALNKIVTEKPNAAQAFGASTVRDQDYFLVFKEKPSSDNFKAFEASMENTLRQFADSDALSTYRLAEMIGRYFNARERYYENQPGERAPLNGDHQAAQDAVNWVQKNIKQNPGTHLTYELNYILASLLNGNDKLTTVYPQQDGATEILLDSGILVKRPVVKPSEIVQFYINSANGTNERAIRGLAEAGSALIRSSDSYKNPLNGTEAINLFIKALDYCKQTPGNAFTPEVLFGLGKAYYTLGEFSNSKKVFDELANKFGSSNPELVEQAKKMLADQNAESMKRFVQSLYAPAEQGAKKTEVKK